MGSPRGIKSLCNMAICVIWKLPGLLIERIVKLFRRIGPSPLWWMWLLLPISKTFVSAIFVVRAAPWPCSLITAPNPLCAKRSPHLLFRFGGFRGQSRPVRMSINHVRFGVIVVIIGLPSYPCCLCQLCAGTCFGCGGSNVFPNCIDSSASMARPRKFKTVAERLAARRLQDAARRRRRGIAVRAPPQASSESVRPHVQTSGQRFILF